MENCGESFRLNYSREMVMQLWISSGEILEKFLVKSKNICETHAEILKKIYNKIFQNEETLEIILRNVVAQHLTQRFSRSVVG